MRSSRKAPMRRINTGGIVIVLGDSHALPVGTTGAMPMIEHAPLTEVSDE
jgi:hypothetical protein